MGQPEEEPPSLQMTPASGSAPYQIVFHGRKELPYVWDSRFKYLYGSLRDVVRQAHHRWSLKPVQSNVRLNSLRTLNFCILAHGAARVYCEGCKRSLLVAASLRGELVEPCKRRVVCRSCGAKRAVKFAEHIYNEVIEDIPHRHKVFTIIPKRLQAFFRYDRKLNSILFKAA